MKRLVVHSEKLTPEAVEALAGLCPFGAIERRGPAAIEVSSACRMCGVCTRKGPAGAMEIVQEGDAPKADTASWRGIAVYAELSSLTRRVHPVAFELLGKARELAAVTGHPVVALLIGSGLDDAARELLEHGAEKAYLYDAPQFADFTMDAYAAAFSDFVEKVRPSSVLVGATPLGRSLAPRVAARFGTGLTADCTRLEMKPSADLVQIRPAFGGNIMAQIVNPDHRPQFCTVRYRIFDAKRTGALPGAEIVRLAPPEASLRSVYTVLETRRKPPEADISEAEFIVACGRGVKPGAELELAKRFADRLGATLACTRPMAEAGHFDPRRQIGLSGRTVKPKLIITLGVSGAVQFAAGMRNSDRIIAINTDPEAPIFKIAHVGLVGDWRDIVRPVLEN